MESVPELKAYPYIRLSNNQNPYFSRTQMTGEQFDSLCRVLSMQTAVAPLSLAKGA